MTTGRSRAGLTGLAVVLVVGLFAAPAAADPPRPTNYRSTVVEVVPDLPAGAEVRVVGGDSLLELTMPRGHTAVIADYATSDDAESVPYLRFDADGTVRRNQRAVATTANESRFGATSGIPDPSSEPRWETVSTNGSYAWHDHRIHWMSPKTPQSVAEDGRVDLGGPDGTWSVPITVDGTETVITGELVLVDAPSPLLGIAAVVAALALSLAIALRWGLAAGAALGALTGVTATATAWSTWQAVPAGAGASVVPVLIAVVAVLAGLAGTFGPARTRLVAVAATAAALLGWGLTRWTVLTRAVLPTTLPYGVDRVVTAVALGVGLGLAVALVWRPSGTRSPATPAEPVRASPTA